MPKATSKTAVFELDGHDLGRMMCGFVEKKRARRYLEIDRMGDLAMEHRGHLTSSDNPGHYHQ